jgi:hypothetical protein
MVRVRLRLHPWLLAALVLASVGAGLRIQNAFRYPINMGFDAQGNWEYVETLVSDWTLPAPDEGWSTAHPPLFYYLSAALGRALGHPGKTVTVIATRLFSAGAGLLTIGLAVSLVRRSDPHNLRRALLAGALLLFLPVQVYMSAMFSEEILVSFLISLVIVGMAWAPASPHPTRGSLAWAAGLGCVAGLALLTKLTGLLAIVAGGLAYLINGLRREPGPALLRAFVFASAAAVVGGWFYARNLAQYGYVYPHALEVHSAMFEMPPGTRGIGDYLRFPLSTFTNADLLAPDLLHSVWGSTFITVWSDGHGHFLSKDDITVSRVAKLTLVLAILPTLAFLIGLSRGCRRAMRSSPTPDTLLLILVGLMLLGYATFTWRNPWFVTVKASFLLGLSVPFAYYASEVLDDWTRAPTTRSILVWGALVLLFALVVVTFTYGLIFSKHEFPGLDWRSLP